MHIEDRGIYLAYFTHGEQKPYQKSTSIDYRSMPKNMETPLSPSRNSIVEFGRHRQP